MRTIRSYENWRFLFSLSRARLSKRYFSPRWIFFQWILTRFICKDRVHYSKVFLSHTNGSAWVRQSMIGKILLTLYFERVIACFFLSSMIDYFYLDRILVESIRCAIGWLVYRYCVKLVWKSNDTHDHFFVLTSSFVMIVGDIK